MTVSRFSGLVRYDGKFAVSILLDGAGYDRLRIGSAAEEQS